MVTQSWCSKEYKKHKHEKDNRNINRKVCPSYRDINATIQSWLNYVSTGKTSPKTKGLGVRFNIFHRRSATIPFLHRQKQVHALMQIAKVIKEGFSCFNYKAKMKKKGGISCSQIEKLLTPDDCLLQFTWRWINPKHLYILVSRLREAKT